jgi:hypothetical protein
MACCCILSCEKPTTSMNRTCAISIAGVSDGTSTTDGDVGAALGWLGSRNISIHKTCALPRFSVTSQEIKNGKPNKGHIVGRRKRHFRSANCGFRSELFHNHMQFATNITPVKRDCTSQSVSIGVTSAQFAPVFTSTSRATSRLCAFIMQSRT